VRVAIVGAGIVGLATAHRLLERVPGVEVTVLDKEPRIAAHQSSHNSGVLHAGLYYEPGSQKARLCVRGKEQLEAYASAKGIPILRCGKTVVASADEELAGLVEIERRARKNGVAGLRRLDRRDLGTVEPEVDGIAALHSPGTAVIDFRAVCAALAHDVRAAGGQVVVGREVDRVDDRGYAATYTTADGTTSVDAVVVCAGLHGDRIGPPPDHGERIVGFRGSWYLLDPRHTERIRGCVYPVPDPRYPFLGVHLTPQQDGPVLVGPNAVLAPGREGYRGRRPDLTELLGLVREPGVLRMARQNLRAGTRELFDDASRTRYARKVGRYLPGVVPEDLHPGPSGVRAQLVTRRGRLADDFVIDGSLRVVRVLNAPSPAATASLAIADGVVDEILSRR
jgi:L-2-hydroxyglutarate oxidase LhgO